MVAMPKNGSGDDTSGATETLIRTDDLQKPPLDNDDDGEFNPTTFQNASPTISSSSTAAPASLTPPTDPPSTKPKTWLRFLHVSPHITPLNFLSYLFAALFTICALTLVNSMQAFYLDNVIGITDGAGTASGDLGFWDQIVSIPMAAVWGSLSDLTGRRVLYAVGFWIIALDLYFWTLATDLYPGVLLCRLFFAVGSSCVTSMLTAVLADTAGKGRGTLSGIVGTVSGLGALLAIFGLLQLPLVFGGDAAQATLNTFYVLAGMLVAVGIIIFFTLYKDNPSFSFSERRFITKPSHHIHPAVRKRTNLWVLLKQGVVCAKDYRVALSYVSGFAARTNGIAITLFIPLWVNAYFNANGLCPEGTVDPRNEEEVKELCRDAFTEASIITGITQVAALITAPIFGILSDKLGQTSSLQKTARYTFVALPSFIGTLIAGLSYFVMFQWTDPRQGSLLAVVTLLGIGEIGTVVTGTALASAEFVDPEVRGSVAGMFSLAGSVGVLLMTKLGGYLFDYWLFTGPFFLAGVVHMIAAFVSLICILIEWMERRRTGTWQVERG